MNQSKNKLAVQSSSHSLEQLKYEIAQQLNIQLPNDGYYGQMITRETGSIGGFMVRNMIEIAERSLAAGSNPQPQLEYEHAGDGGSGGIDAGDWLGRINGGQRPR